ncbi:MAG TPA: ABC transporter permease, partial [Methylomirabilota bacterium]|nr:ABC transporter permease [Methylomirabilota bacterium]
MTLMTTTPADDVRRPRRERTFARIARASSWLDALGLGWTVPLLRIAAGDNPREQLAELRQVLVIPLLGILLFVAAWAALAPRVQTSLGAIPGPAEVWAQALNLAADHAAERQKKAEFHAREATRNAELVAEGNADKVRQRVYTGKPTYLDQVLTSLVTVGFGFAIATLIAVPLGIASGLSRTVSGAINPLIQIFKPVSPLAWLPIVTMVVSAVYVDTSEMLPKSLVISAVTV